MRQNTLTLVALWKSFFFVQCLAQTSRLFQWSFRNSSVATSSSLSTCSSLSILVQSDDPTTNATHGTPPYYMIAFVLGGAPTTTLIGSNEATLNWTVTHPVGSQIMLEVVDANGSAGGVSSQVFTVTAGTSTQCVISPPSTDFKITTNATGNLSTCEPWKFVVAGGTSPYTLTLAAPGSRAVTNVTLNTGDNAYTYINRAAPSGQLLGAMSDSGGRWATGTTIVDTVGSTDTTCSGLLSSSGSATVATSSATPSATITSGTAGSGGSKKNRTTIIAVATVVSVLGALVLCFALYFCTQRKRQEKAKLQDAITPRQFLAAAASSVPGHSEPDSPVVIRSNLNVTTSPWTVPGTGGMLEKVRHHRAAGLMAAGSSSHPETNSSEAQLSTKRSRPSVASPSMSAGGSRSPQDLGSEQNESTMSTTGTSGSGSNRFRTIGGNDSAQLLPSTQDDDGALVIQHRDGGRVVKELPPSYLDASSNP